MSHFQPLHAFIFRTRRCQNADKYKHYERWATAHGFPRENIINDGTTSGTGGIGALTDFDLVLRSRRVDDDVLVVAGDMLFNPKSFDLDGVARCVSRAGAGGRAGKVAEGACGRADKGAGYNIGRQNALSRLSLCTDV